MQAQAAPFSTYSAISSPRYAFLTSGFALISAGSPAAITIPCWSTVIFSEMPKTMSMSCSVKTRVKPCSREIFRSRAIVSRLSNRDIPAVGSSSIRSFGRHASGMAISSLFWSPGESPDAEESNLSARPTSPRIARTSPVTSRKFRARARADRVSLWGAKRATRTVSKTGQHGEEGRLPRAVRPDDRADLPFLHGKGDLLEGPQASEGLYDVADFEKSHLRIQPLRVR